MLYGAKQKKEIQRDLERLENKIEATVDEWAKEKLEFADLYDRIYRILKRHEMRDRRAAMEEEESTAPETPCADPVTARVRARREAKSHVLG